MKQAISLIAEVDDKGSNEVSSSKVMKSDKLGKSSVKCIKRIKKKNCMPIRQIKQFIP